MSDYNLSFTREVSTGDLGDLFSGATEIPVETPAPTPVEEVVHNLETPVPTETPAQENAVTDTPPVNDDAEEWNLGDTPAATTNPATAADFAKLAEALGVEPEKIKTVDDVLDLLNSEGNIEFQARQTLKADGVYSSLTKLIKEPDDTILLAAFKGNPAQFFNIEGNTPEEKLESVKGGDVTAYRNLVSGVKNLIESTLAAREKQAYENAQSVQRTREEQARAEATKRVAELKQYVDDLFYYGKKIPASLKEAILSPTVQEEFINGLLDDKEMLVGAMLQFSKHPLAATLRERIGSVQAVPGKVAAQMSTSRPAQSPTAPVANTSIEDVLKMLERQG